MLLRYKKPADSQSANDNAVEIRQVVAGDGNRILISGTSASKDFNFAAAVATDGQLLRSSNYLGTWTYDDTASLAQRGLDKDAQGYRREFAKMVKLTSILSARTP